MVQSNAIKKTLVYVLIGLVLGAGFFPSIIANQSQKFTDVGAAITLSLAHHAASLKLQDLNKNDFLIIESIQIHDENQKPLFYVFNLNPDGYIIVSASYNLPPIVAYSFTNLYVKDTENNPLFDMLSADLTLRLKNIDLLPDVLITEWHHEWDSYIAGKTVAICRLEQWPPEGSTPTGGWLLENWNQGSPYNNFCPVDIAHGGSRSVAGCPAVAMAQILHYHSTTMNIQFDDNDDYYHSFDGNNYWIDDDYVQYGFPSFPQLNSYLTTLQSHYENHDPPTNDDKAAITFACGVAETQVYSSSVSGTYGVSQAYEAYERFNFTTVELLDENDPDFFDRLSNNMKDALPAHLAVVNPQWTTGHNLVVDGYNTNDYYHLNFGWGGSYNGWYLIPDELPYQLTVIEGVIIDILKNTAIPDLTCNGSLEWINVTPNETVSGSFTVSNIGEEGSYLDWEIINWPTWGEWTFHPSTGNNLRPEDGPTIISVDVVVPNMENHLFTGEIAVTNRENHSDFSTIPISLQTGIKTHEKLFCNGSLTWTAVKPWSTISGSFTVENIGAALSNLSWEITDWPDWGTWTFDPTQGTNLTPEDEPVTVIVNLKAPLKRNTQFSGEITLVNSNNNSDYDTIPVSLATPHYFHPTVFNIISLFFKRFPELFPLLQFLFT